MKSRKKKSPVRAKRYLRKQQSQGINYQPLEDRNLLASVSYTDVVNFVSGTDLVRLEQPVPIEQAEDLLAERLQLGEKEAVQLNEIKTDQIGFQHYEYQQTYDGIPVEGSKYKLHVKDGNIELMSGQRVSIVNPTIGTQISEEVALQAALDHIDADLYAWEDPVLADLLNLDGLPDAETVFLTTADESFVGYVFDIYALDPGTRDYVYVNANSGEVISTYSQIRNVDVAADGESHYDGVVNFTADDPDSGDFRLFQEVDMVHTFDNQEGNPNDFSGATEIESTSTTFDHLSGVSAHWGAEQTLKYFQEYHNRDSYDDRGTILISYVNVGQNWDNATWNGSVMQYGEGNVFGPLVTPDIVGHEIAHGVTQFSANLVYAYEPGALNESFSDIFGEAVEWYARGGNNDWLVGGDAIAGGLRDFVNPNAGNQPDTYLGDQWWTSPGDNGGVHFNSGVQNKWFHLLSEGADNYVNDNDESYTFGGIGFEKAAEISYRNLTVYLGRDSQYQDARDGAVQAAIDLYGEGSDEHIATSTAWAAVGLYGPEVEVFEFNEIIPGSLIYQSEGSSEVVGEGRPLVMDLDSNQSLTFEISSTDGLQPTVTVESPNSASVVFNPGPNGSVVGTVEILDAGTYRLVVDGLNGTDGEFDYKIYLNGELERENTLGTGDNDSLANAENIDLSSVALTTSGDRLGVVGRFDATEIPVVDGDSFEAGILDGQWETNELGFGRIQVTNQFGAADGDFALIMDTDADIPVQSLNEAIWTVDLSTTTNPILSFAFAEWNDENNPLPAVFQNSWNGDGVSVSDDGIVWHTILTDTETAAGQWNQFTVNLEDIANNFGLDLNSEFKVKFQQYDDGRITDDGRGYDNIQIIGGASSQDWYSFSAVVGQDVTLAVGNSRFVSNTVVELYDDAGTLLATSTANLNNLNSIVSYDIPDTGTYFARVTARGVLDYGLVVTRGVEFDGGSTLTSPQEISSNGGVLGSVSVVADAKADPDNFTGLTALDNFFEGVTLSDGITGGSVFSAETSYQAPTGERIFSTSTSDDDGWQENVNEFRADFDITQFRVAIDVGSDDGASDVSFLRGFNIFGELIAETISGSLEPGQRQTIFINRAEGDIAYITAGGLGNDRAPVDNLQYEISSESGTSDHYSIQSPAGQTLRVNVSFPGAADPFLFDNRLVNGDDTFLQLELLDSNGNVVATGADRLDYYNESAGSYTLKVTTSVGRGNYFIQTETIDGIVFNIGDNGDGVAVWDAATGTGYLMYSVESVHTRFASDSPFPTNAENFVAVRHNGTNWEYNDNLSWHTFTPTEGDRLVAFVNFSGDHVNSLQGAFGEVEGIVQGFDDSDMTFRANRWAGASNGGEFEVTGTYFVDSDKRRTVGDLGDGVAAQDGATGQGYLLYSVESVHTRFGGLISTNADHFIAVRNNNGTWQYDSNSAWIDFTPTAGDQLVADIDFDAGTITSLKGAASAVAGINLGFAIGDIDFVANRWAGSGNTGEFEVRGTFFTVNNLDYGQIGELGDGIAVDDSATGTGFLMYTAQPVPARFTGNPAFPTNARHLIAVRWDAVSSTWQYNNNTVWSTFTPIVGDRLLASLDFDANTATSMQGNLGEFNGIGFGYTTGDLTFLADSWAGSRNSGEFEVRGTFFEV
ncbi:MAG: M4 family metallopeptidase [Planctomycetota bacterium]